MTVATAITSQSEDQMQRAFLLNVVILERPAIHDLFASEDDSLLVGWDSFLVLDSFSNRLNRVAWVNIDRQCPSSQSLDKDLHTAAAVARHVARARC